MIVGQIQHTDYFEHCQHLIAELGLSDSFIFLGQRTDIPEILKSVDFAISASRLESGPLIIAEYLASSLPVVATRTGSISRIADQNGVPGFVEPNDPTSLAAAIDQLISLTPAEREQRGKLGRRVADKCFDLRTKITAWYEIYDNLMKK